MAVELGSPEFWQHLQADPARLAAEVTKIDLINLEQTLQQHAALYAWVAATHEMAAVEEERAKWALTKARARATLLAKMLPDEHTKKDKTVGVLAAEVDAHAAVEEATLAYLAAQEKAGALRAMTRALADRKDMLVQISAKHREERKVYS